ncbi:MAG TPA: glycosyltransferase family 1 protein [Thermoanaerobaculia bacterium]|jgi:glycosyltransferase involved in cell wall biosynthesis|nr:glycosyltransferase family 1 protein [Thermoanaerobaculia bacterium]
MNVLVDGRPLVGNRTGIGVHTAEIARRLPFDVTIASHAEIRDRERLESLRFRVDPMPLGVLWQQVKLPRLDGDVLWGPHGTLPLAWKKPSVVTLHDFTSITMPLRHRARTILSFNLFIGASLELATRVACVSRVVADEAMRGFGVPASKIELVPNGVDDFFTPGPVKEEDEEEDFILFAGTLEPRKGIDDLVDAWRALPRTRPRLVLCGGEGWGMRIANDEGIVRTGYVTREQLRDLYRRALTFVYPSRHEGFGLPPLEAMACGAPVLATRTGAIADYAEGAALLVDPGARDDLRDALARLVRDASLRRELRARGPERASSWRWERPARVMSDLILTV